MNILFINSVEPACGVHQFGLNLFRILRESKRHRFSYCAPWDFDHLLHNIKASSEIPEPDLLFYNFYPCTMPWVSLETLTAIRRLGLKQVTIFHEVPVTGFDALIYPDPTFADTSRQLNDWYGMGRPLPARRHSAHVRVRRDVPVIGSSGFGFGDKGYPRLVEKVLGEFERACIRLHLPYATHGDATGERARAMADECRALVAGTPGIQLEIDHAWLAPEDYLDWLAGNDLNAYLYNEMPGRGIASTIDHALAVHRPIAITRSHMFRHLWDCAPSLCVEDHSLTEIMAAGLAPLEPLYAQFRDETILARVESILERVREQAGEWRTSWNRLLRSVDRVGYGPLIEEMRSVVPELLARKLPEANVQQAFCLDLVRRCGPDARVLCVGCFEDTAFEVLRRERPIHAVIGIDPSAAGQGTFDYDLAAYRQNNPEERYGCVFACSVLEHVPDDEQFFRDLCDCLLPDGVGILTCDFKADYKAGDPLPATDVRLYTPEDIHRLGLILRTRGCYWVEAPDLHGDPDFTYQGHHYSFLGLVFKKL